MSKRAEEAALKVYSIEDVTFMPQDLNVYRREGFVEGYELAEKDTIERVIEWVKRNGYLYVNRAKEGDEYVGEFMEEPFVESLRKALEEEK